MGLRETFTKLQKMALMSKFFLVVPLAVLVQVLGYFLGGYFDPSVRIFFHIALGFLFGLLLGKLFMGMSKEQRILKELGEKRRELLENTGDFVFTLDIEGKIISFNKKAEKITGYKREEVIGKSFAMFLSSEGIRTFFDKLGELGKTEFLPPYEAEINTVYGKKILELKLAAIKSDGRLLEIQCIGKDTTEIKILEKELQEKTFDFEKLSKRTLSRELKLVELEKRVEALQKLKKRRRKAE
ncbi:MAG: PAS domain S-box protein [Candidatus Hydrothermarchaeales archaeon]